MGHKFPTKSPERRGIKDAKPPAPPAPPKVSNLKPVRRFMFDGKDLSRKENEWLDSDEGLRMRSGTASGQYLDNRLMLAFQAGVEAALELLAEKLR